MTRAIVVTVGLTVLLFSIFGLAAAEADIPEQPVEVFNAFEIPLTHQAYKVTTVYTVTNLGNDYVHYTQNGCSTLPHYCYPDDIVYLLEPGASHTRTASDYYEYWRGHPYWQGPVDTLFIGSSESDISVTYALIDLPPLLLYLPAIVK